MKAVEKKRIDCGDLIAMIKECPSLTRIFGTETSETFMNFVTARGVRWIEKDDK